MRGRAGVLICNPGFGVIPRPTGREKQNLATRPLADITKAYLSASIRLPTPPARRIAATLSTWKKKIVKNQNIEILSIVFNKIKIEAPENYYAAPDPTVVRFICNVNLPALATRVPTNITSNRTTVVCNFNLLALITRVPTKTHQQQYHFRVHPNALSRLLVECIVVQQDSAPS